MSTLRNALNRVLQWMREHGLGWFGAIEHDVIGCCMLVYHWGFLVPARWEVWYFGAFGLRIDGQPQDIPMKSKHLRCPWITVEMKDAHFAPLQQGSQERYRSIEMRADIVCAVKDESEARAAIAERNRRTYDLLRGWDKGTDKQPEWMKQGVP